VKSEPIEIPCRTVTVTNVPDQDGRTWPDGIYMYMPDVIDTLLTLGMMHKVDLSREVSQLRRSMNA
jgi:hypothetical protein